MALTDYINQTRRLLHDANGQYWSDAELTSDINQARNRIALDSGCVRTIFNFMLSSGQESYPYTGAVAAITVTHAGVGYTSSPTVSFSGGGGSAATATAAISNGTVSAVVITANGYGFTSAPTVTLTGGGPSTTATVTATVMTAFDILNISVNWGNSWVTLAYYYFTAFQARARYYRNISGQPAVWSSGPAPNTGGGRWFYIFQVPSGSYQADIDAIIQPNALVDDSTAEQLIYPYTDCVQYWSAYLAKYKQQEMAEAEKFLRIYDELMRRGNAAHTQRRIPNAFGLT